MYEGNGHEVETESDAAYDQNVTGRLDGWVARCQQVTMELARNACY